MMDSRNSESAAAFVIVQSSELADAQISASSPLAGKPLIRWSIDAARAASSVGAVVVVTDNPAIAAISEPAAVKAVIVPGTATTEEALVHALEAMTSDGRELPELAVLLSCTSPLTNADDIDATVAALRDQNSDTAFAGVNFESSLWSIESDGSAGNPKYAPNEQSQPSVTETGAVYVMKTRGFLKHKRRLFGKAAVHVLPAERDVKVSEPAHLAIAEVLIRRRHKHHAKALLPDPVDAVVFDFDGVFTDNKVILTEHGEEAAVCSRGDGMGIDRLRAAGITTLVLSKEPVPIVMKRCEKLKLPCLHGIDNKLPALKAWLEERNLRLDHTVYVGNDINDLECLTAAGCGVAVADAHESVFPAANLVLTRNGGNGAVRELCDLLVS